MNALFKRDITIKTISVLLAVFLWFIVLNIADPFKKITLSVPLTVSNESALQEKGIVNKIKDYPKTISVTVRARESIAKNLTANDFKVSIDFSKVDSMDMKELQVEGPVYIGDGNKKDIQIVEVKPSAISMDLDKLGQNPFKVEVEALGNMKNNYKIVKITSIPDTLSIQAPDSQIKLVSSIKALVDVTNLDRDLTIRKNCKVYDKYGEEIPGLGSNLSVDIKIEVAKEVPVTPVVKGNPAKNYIGLGPKVKPEKALITGTPELLAKIEDLKTEPISIENASANVDVSRFLVIPQGIKLVNTPQEVAVSIVVSLQARKTFAISKDDIHIANKNMDNSLQYEILTPQLDITVKGIKEDLDNLNVSAFSPSVDVNGLGEGIHKIPLKLILPENVTLVKNSSGNGIQEGLDGNTTVSDQDYLVEVKIQKA
ncbi:MAG: CdaR family protein [Clostridiales bacterium]|nr:CdaR family protein [Eubacteriales bacterium]MDH7565975.1 CdaR family protein [Clostridiales bacterium]